jgi:hypothetical protein
MKKKMIRREKSGEKEENRSAGGFGGVNTAGNGMNPF